MSVSVFEEKARVLAGLAKGVEVYVEGRLTMNTWEGSSARGCRSRRGASRFWGRIGKSRPAKALKHAEEFDDALAF